MDREYIKSDGPNIMAGISYLSMTWWWFLICTRPTCSHVDPLGNSFLIPNHPDCTQWLCVFRGETVSWFRTIQTVHNDSVCSEEKHYISIIQSFCFTRHCPGSNQRSIALRSSTITQVEHHHSGRAPSFRSSTITQVEHHHSGRAPSLRSSTITQVEHHHSGRAPSLRSSTITQVEHQYITAAVDIIWIKIVQRLKDNPTPAQTRGYINGIEHRRANQKLTIQRN